MVTAKAAQSKKTVASASTVRTNQNLGLLAERNSAVSSVNVSMNDHMPFKTFYFTDSYSIRHIYNLLKEQQLMTLLPSNLHHKLQHLHVLPSQR